MKELSKTGAVAINNPWIKENDNHDRRRRRPTRHRTPTKQLRRETRLFRIAAAIASGATVTEIANTEGIGRTSASKQVNSTACRQLILQFVNEEHELMMELFYRALRVIEHGFSARREYLLKDGQTLIGGPDHYARLSAAKHLREFLLAGRPIPREEESQRRTVTLEELEEMLRPSERPPSA